MGTRVCTGTYLIVAGSLGKSGAAVMSGSAALFAGAGLVTVATPDVVLPIVAAAHPEYMTEALVSTTDGMASQSESGGRAVLPRSKKGRQFSPSDRGLDRTRKRRNLFARL